MPIFGTPDFIPKVHEPFPNPLFQWEFEDDEEESDGKSSDSEDDEFATGLASELISF